MVTSLRWRDWAGLALAVSVASCGGGGGAGTDTRIPQTVLFRLIDTQGQFGQVWNRPALARSPALSFAPGQIDHPECKVNSDDPSPDKDVTDPAVDSFCSVPDCAVGTGYSRYNSRLGQFSLEFINNSSRSTDITVEKLGFDIHVRNAQGGEVWDMELDHLDYLDLETEVGHLMTYPGAASCPGKVLAALDIFGLQGSIQFALAPLGLPVSNARTIAAGDIYKYAVTWDGTDHNGVPVPAGTYTVSVDVKIKDAASGEAWTTPEPLTLTINDPAQ